MSELKPLDTPKTAEEFKERTIELLQEVISSHCDKGDPNYNECEEADAECCWCGQAKEVMDYLTEKKGGGDES